MFILYLGVCENLFQHYTSTQCFTLSKTFKSLLAFLYCQYVSNIFICFVLDLSCDIQINLEILQIRVCVVFLCVVVIFLKISIYQYTLFEISLIHVLIF